MHLATKLWFAYLLCSIYELTKRTRNQILQKENYSDKKVDFLDQINAYSFTSRLTGKAITQKHRKCMPIKGCELFLYLDNNHLTVLHVIQNNQRAWKKIQN